MTNPDNFVGHRQALMRMSRIVPALAAAWVLTGDERYSEHAARHLRAWFVDEAHAHDPAPALCAGHPRASRPAAAPASSTRSTSWRWRRRCERSRARPGSRRPSGTAVGAVVRRLPPLDDHRPNGLEERDAKNNHGTCWVCRWPPSRGSPGTSELLAYGRDRFRTVLVPGSRSPRTAASRSRRRAPSPTDIRCSTSTRWRPGADADHDGGSLDLQLPAGGDGRRSPSWPVHPDRKGWPYPPDVMYDDRWPMRQASLLFASLAYGETSYLELWKIAARRLGCRRGRPQLLRPPAGPVGAVAAVTSLRRPAPSRGRWRSRPRRGSRAGSARPR